MIVNDWFPDLYSQIRYERLSIWQKYCIHRQRLRWEFIQENKKVKKERKHAFDQEIKKKITVKKKKALWQEIKIQGKTITIKKKKEGNEKRKLELSI